MKLNIYVYLLVSVFLSAYSTMNKEEPTSEGAPNVLFIPVDDLKPMLSCYGDSLVKTPNIDRIAKRGTVFLNTACQQAICGPSRASLLTGMYPDQTKVWDLTTKMRDINPDILTIPQYFKQQGYTTTGIGKTFDPRCVDNGKFMDKPSWSIPYQKAKSIQYANPEVKVAWGKAEKLIEGQTFDVAYKRNRAIAQAGILMARPSTECMDVPDDIYSDGANTKVALDLMEKLAQSENPFFLSVGYAKPHLPFIAPKKYWDLYDRSSIPLAPFQQKSENGP
ncbi:MAG: sulfatase-like hydrolase/transferase, partial [Bacteroidota bacterium]